MSWQHEYLAKYYSAASGWTDGNVVFHNLLRSTIPQDGEILEIGAGPTNITSDFLATLGRVTGVDIDPDVQNNTALAAAHVLDGEAYPFPDNTFDACVSNYVIEHVADPTGHLTEIGRVLKPGGVYIFPHAEFLALRLADLAPDAAFVSPARRQSAAKLARRKPRSVPDALSAEYTLGG